jgi:hypothetical protein
MYCVSDGMLQGRGNLTPLGYYRTWKAAFAQPIHMEDRGIQLTTGPSGSINTKVDAWYERDERPQAIEALRSAGYHSEADALSADQPVSLRLYADGDVLASIYGDVASGGRIAPWKIIDRLGSSIIDTSLAPASLERRSDVGFHLYRTESGEPGREVLVLDLGEGRCTVGYRGDLLGWYLEHEAPQKEASAAGSGIGAVIALEKALKGNHPMLPGGWKFGLDVHALMAEKPYMAQYVQDVAERLGMPEAVETGLLITTAEGWRKQKALERALGVFSRWHFQLIYGSGNEPLASTSGELFAA